MSPGADLAEHAPHRLDLLVEVRRGGVGHVQDDVGVGHLLQRRAERLHEVVRQLADEPHGVGDRRPAAARELELARGRVERREQLVGDQGVARPVSALSRVDLPAFV